MAKTYVTSVTGRTYTKSALRQQNREYRAYKRSERNKARAIRIDKSRSFDVERDVSAISVFSVIFMVLFIINFFYSATGNSSSFSFSSLLQAIQNAPSVPTDWIKTFSDLRITADWTVAFNWLRDFLNNYVMKLITVFLFLCTGIVQLLTYSIYFISILFGGV